MWAAIKSNQVFFFFAHPVILRSRGYVAATFGGINISILF